MAKKSLDSDDPLPLYQQLANVLEEEINKGIYIPGDNLPTEKELEEEFQVSRTTVRKAYQQLHQKGIVNRRSGVGTKVAEEKFSENITQLKSFTEEMSEMGYSVTSKVLKSEEIEAPHDVQEPLELADKDRVLHVKRLRYVDGVPLALQKAYLPVSLGVSNKEDFTGSLYKLLEKEYGIDIKSGSIKIETSLATQEEADILDIEPGEPVMVFRRKVFRSNDTPMEYVKGVYRGDRHQFQVKLKRY